MNLLAHLYLSTNNTQVIIGNFAADGIKGKNLSLYSTDMQKGIRLHRQIDFFTDNHPIVKQSKRRLHKRYRHYKGIIIDIFYDHFLAKNWKEYSVIPFDVYIHSMYDLLTNQIELLPEKIRNMIPHMIHQNWLYNYQYLEGIQETLNGMNYRSNNQSQMHLAVEDLTSFYSDFETDFTLFFPDLIAFVKEKNKTF